MITRALLTAGFLAGLLAPLDSRAQTAPHFYVGVGGSMLNGFGRGSSRLFGPSLTAGLQVKPRLAVQVGATVTWRNSYTSYSYQDNSQQLPTVYTYSSREKFITIPVLLRSTLSTSAKRLQVDALTGISLSISTGRYASTITYGNQTQFDNNHHDTGFLGSLVAGPALRYALTPQVALTAEVPVNFVISNFRGPLSDHFFYNLQVGARYNFG